MPTVGAKLLRRRLGKGPACKMRTEVSCILWNGERCVRLVVSLVGGDVAHQLNRDPEGVVRAFHVEHLEPFEPTSSPSLAILAILFQRATALSSILNSFAGTCLNDIFISVSTLSTLDSVTGHPPLARSAQWSAPNAQSHRSPPNWPLRASSARVKCTMARLPVRQQKALV